MKKSKLSFIKRIKWFVIEPRTPNEAMLKGFLITLIFSLTIIVILCVFGIPFSLIEKLYPSKIGLALIIFGIILLMSVLVGAFVRNDFIHTADKDLEELERKHYEEE